MTTILCTNSDCKAEISVPSGTMSVICPTCNTWHFLASEEYLAPDGPVAQNDYESPVSFTGAGDTPAGLPTYEAYHLPGDGASPGLGLNSNELPSQQTIDPGYLVSDQGIRYPLKEGKNMIGRKESDIQIDDQTVSRQHCIVEVSTKHSSQGWSYMIYDIGHIAGNASANGVLIAGRSIRLQNHERIPIGKGTVIRLGAVNLTLKY